MSLLMDALRKAEESKKQVEQDKKAVSSARATAPVRESVSSENVAVSDPAEQVQFCSTDKPGSIAIDKPLSDADVQIEFTDLASTPTSLAPESLELAADISSSATSFELEPRLHTTVRDQNLGDDQPSNSVPVDEDEILAKEPMSLARRDDDADSISSFLSSTTLEKAVSQASAELEKEKPGAALETFDYKTDATKTPAIDVPQAKPEPIAESISDRTAGSRESAKSVFAAKKLSQKENRKALIAGAGITVGIMFGAGFYLYAYLTPSSSIYIPAGDFPITQPFENKRSINDLIARDERVALLAAEAQADIDSAAENPLQVDSSLGFGGVADNTQATLIDEQLPSLESTGLVETRATSLNGQALVAVSPDSFSSSSSSAVSVSPVYQALEKPINEPLDEAFVAENFAAENSPSSVGSSFTDNGDSQSDSGPTLGAVSNVTSVAPPAPRELVSFRRTDQPQGIAPALIEGFKAYQDGDLDLARDLYQQTLTDSPENIDALLGLAAFASSRQEINLAMGLYSRALSLDPSNALAKTAISSLAPLGTPAEQERELRRLDSQNPNVAPLVFALGNFYASQSRWTDAQRYYFKALQLAKSDSQSGSSISPDYAFNLAVSLEQLNQSGPALIFYEEALALATRFPANFDLSIARSRLESLSRKSSP